MHQYKVPIILILLFIFAILLFSNRHKKTSGYSPINFELAKDYKEVLLAEYPGHSSTRLKQIPDDVLYTLVTDFKIDETRNYILYEPADYVSLSKKDVNTKEVKDAIKKIKDNTSALIQTDYKDFSPATIQLYKSNMMMISSSSFSSSYIK